jgi:hypothetical protein
MSNIKLVTLLERLFHEAYRQGKTDGFEGVYISEKELYLQFCSEHFEFFPNEIQNFLHSELNTIKII